MDRYTAFHEILVTLFHEVIDIEHKAIISGSFKDITTNDMHVIEAIGTGEPKNMSSKMCIRDRHTGMDGRFL